MTANDHDRAALPGSTPGNPYAAPDTELPELPTDAEIAHAVGVYDRYPLLAKVVARNFGLYARRWHLDTGGSARPWHWPALFVDIYWLLYRKMYLPALVYLGAAFVAGGVIAFLPNLEVVALGLLLTLKLVLCLTANALYRWHCRRLIARTQARYPDQPDRVEAELGRRGGTSTLAVVAGVIVIGAINLLSEA